jgi:hypothetical protein
MHTSEKSMSLAAKYSTSAQPPVRAGKVQERKRATVQERKRNSGKVVVFSAGQNVLRGSPGH